MLSKQSGSRVFDAGLGLKGILWHGRLSGKHSLPSMAKFYINRSKVQEKQPLFQIFIKTSSNQYIDQ